MQEIKEKLIKWFPLILSLFIVLIVGLSMIGSFYVVKEKIDGQKFYYSYSLIELLFHNPASVSMQVFYILLYLVIPAVACTCLFLNKFHKNFSVVSLLLFLLIAVSSIVAKDAFIYRLSDGFTYDMSISEVSFSAILPTIGFFIAFIGVLVVATNNMVFTVKDLSEMGILIAIALGLNFIKLFPAPTGGSVNLQMLPLFILAIRRGPLKGFLAGGIAYGLITCLTDGYGFAFFPFDYLIGFGSICIMGFFTKLIFPQDKKGYSIRGELFLLLAGIISSFVRFVGGTVSSMIFYDYSLVAAMEYNSLYIFISGGIALAVIMALYGPISQINKRYPVEG